MTEKDKKNIAIIKLMYAGDESELKIIANNIIWHVPGHNPVSGEYHGYEEYTKMMRARMAPLTRWDFSLKDVMVNGDYVMTTFFVQGERKGKKIEMQGGHLIRLDQSGRVAEGWGFADNQDALDEFFAN